MNKIGFWNNVKTLLRNKNINLKYLSDTIKVPYNTLTNWTSRNIIPDAVQAVSIARALNTSVEFLVTGEGLPPDTVNIHKEALQKILEGTKTLTDYYGL